MSPLAGKRILVVEDEPIVAMCLEDMLIELGCRVLGPAARLQEGLAATAADGIDAAILDINLGDATSFPIADRLAQRGVPYLFATGYDRVGTAAHGGAPVLQKPYGIDQLARALSTLLAR